MGSSYPQHLNCDERLKVLTLSHPAEALSPFARSRNLANSSSGTTNTAVPQYKQTTSSGNTHTTGLSMFLSPGECMPTSAVNLRRRTDPHDLHRMPPPHRNLKSFSIDLAHDLFNRVSTVAKIDVIRRGAVLRTQSGSKGRPVASRHV